MKRILFALLALFSLSAAAQNPVPYLTSGMENLVNVNQWHRHGIVISPGANVNLAESSLIYEGNAQILSGNVFKLWHTVDTTTGPFICYEESYDCIHWVRYSGDSVVSQHWRSSVFKLASTYYLFAANKAETQIDEYTSSNGTSFTLANAGVVVSSSFASGTGVYNSWVDTTGSTWYMLLDVSSINYGYADYLLTSTDGAGAVWTPYNASSPPLFPRGAAPFFKKINGTTWGWFLTSGSQAILPSDFVRFKAASSNLQSWTQSPAGMSTFHRAVSYEGPNQIVGQVGDIVMCQAVINGDTCVYMIYTTTVNGNSSGGAGLALAIFNGSFADLVATNENAPPYWQFEYNGNNPVSNSPISIGNWTQTPSSLFDIEPINALDSGNATEQVANISGTAGGSSLVVGSNAQYSNTIGWNNLNPALPAWARQYTNNGWEDLYMPAQHHTALPTNLGGISLVGTKYWKELGSATGQEIVTINYAAVPADSPALYVSGNTDLTNVSGNTWNSLFINKYRGTVSNTDLVISATQNFATNYTGTNNVWLNSNNTVATTPSGNVVIGTGAATAWLTGDYSTVIGQGAAASNTASNWITAVGRDAFNSATGGYQSGVGGEGGRAIVAGIGNSYLGTYALYQNLNSFASTNGSYRTAIGAYSQVTQDTSINLGDVPSGLFNRVGIDDPSPAAYFSVPAGRGVAGYSGLRFKSHALTPTAFSSNGAIVTITFASQPYAPYAVGQFINIFGAASSGTAPNGTWAVSACTTTTVQFNSAITVGTLSTAGTVVEDGKPTSTDTWGIGWHLDSLFAVGQSSTVYQVAFTASPAFTGTPTAPTQSPGDNTTNIATTAFVTNAVGSNTGGIYLPTSSASSNIASITLDSATYIRGGNTISVDGSVTITATSSGSVMSVYLSVPVNSLLSNGHALFGMTTNSSTMQADGIVKSDGTANKAWLSFANPGSTSAVTYYYHYSYQVQ